MDFERSTQARSWIFDDASLAACRERAAAFESAGSKSRARKFASGFHNSFSCRSDSSRASITSTPSLSPYDQETLVRFHAHQIQTLVGPSAILLELRTSETVLSTAITFFRRFYLSNSVVEFNPRQVAAACAFFASKVEEERIEIGLLSHATAVVQLKVQNAPLCRKELRAVSFFEIEQAERDLMEGLNYEFRCHHADPTVHVLANDVACFLSENKTGFCLDERDQTESYNNGDRSPKSTVDYREHADDLLHRAMDVAQRAVVFSDVLFLYPPGHIAFGIIAIAMESVDKSGYLGDEMQEYLVSRFPLKSEEEVLDFSRQVSRIIQLLVQCPWMDLQPTAGRARQIVAQRAEELRRVLAEVSHLRLLRKIDTKPADCRDRKRSPLELDFTPPRQRVYKKMAKVTPIGHY